MRGVERRTFLQHLAIAAMTARWSTPRALAQGTRAATRTIDTDALSIGYEDQGDPAGFPIILLHGFPDDVRAYDDVVPPLLQAGYRTLVPYLRGHGPTRFRDPAAPRMAEQAALGQDVIDFADALRLPRFAVAGYAGAGTEVDGPVFFADRVSPAQVNFIRANSALMERLVRVYSALSSAN